MNIYARLARDGAVDPILFYGGGEWGCFSNFSSHGIWLPSPWEAVKTYYKTTEHRYQALKATDKFDHDYVVKSKNAGQSKDRGREIELREDWGNDEGDVCWYVMLECLIAKSLQHPSVLSTLDRTDDRWIYEDSPVDDIWGWRFQQDYSGKNLLGRCWMQTRFILGSTQ
jgi:ribA/ribD-fused uncharacterized protein